MTICICDDEPKILNDIKNILMSLCDSVEVKGFSKSKDLQKYVEKENIDILFMDIKLNDVNGINFIKQNEKYLKNTKLIYITGYTEYIEDVFETNPIYFLQKPLNEEKIKKAYNKAIEQITSENIDIVFKTAKEIIKMPLDQILYIESKGRLIEIHTENGIKKIYLKLSDIDQIYKDFFIRIHKSFLVNINKIKVYKYSKIILEDNSELTISRSYQKECKDKIMNYMERDYD